MKTLTIILAVMMTVAPIGSAWADLLVKVDDSVLTGAFKGGSDAAVMFEVKGQLQQIDLDEIFLLAFEPRPGSGTGAAASKSGGAPAPGGAILVKLDNSVLHGKYKGGTDSALLFEVGGQLQQVPVGEVKLLVPGSPGAPADKAPSPTAAAVPASRTAPAGTKLMVELTDEVSTASHDGGLPWSKGILAVAPDGGRSTSSRRPTPRCSEPSWSPGEDGPSVVRTSCSASRASWSVTRPFPSRPRRSGLRPVREGRPRPSERAL